MQKDELKPEVTTNDVVSEEVVSNDIPVLEEKELTEEEKREQLIQAIKQSHLNYKPKKHFGVAYKKERKRKNTQAKKSRRANRK